MQELKNKVKELEVSTVVDHKKKQKALELKLKRTHQMLQSVLSDRNILSRSLLTANVIHAILPLKTY